METEGADEPGWRLALAVAVVGSAAAVTVFLWTDRWIWAAEILCHARPLFAAALAGLAAPLALARGTRRAAAALGALAVLNAAPLLPLAAPASPASPATGGPGLRVATANLCFGRDTMPALERWIAAEDPDVVFLCEVDLRHRPAVRALGRRGYEHQMFWPVDELANARSYGRALVSKLPFEGARVHEPGPILDASVEVGGRPVRVLGLHPMRPGRPWRIAMRDRVLDSLAALASASPATIVLGDLNTTEQSYAWRDLLGAGRLADTRAGRGWFGTWTLHEPVFGAVVPGVRLPIDHVLLGPALATVDRRLGPDFGSDHLPVVADVAWRVAR